MKVRSEPLRSYFDTTLGSVVFNLPPAELPEVSEQLAAARRQRKESDAKRAEYIDLLMAWASVRHYPLLAHEWGHALQALTHPALYLRCLREFGAVCAVVDELSKAPQAVAVPLFPGDTWSGDLAWPTYPVRILLDEDGELRIEDSTSKPLPNDISETDLLEDSASIFQYKAEIGADGTAAGYRRWLDEGRKYLYAKSFHLASSVLTPEDAYVAVPPLVMAAYSTNWPVHVFANLLSATVRARSVVPSEMGVDLYWRFLEQLLRDSLKAGEAPEPRRSLFEEADPRRIDRDGVLSLADRFPMHPLSPIVRLVWEDEASTERLRKAMLHPYLAFNRRTRGAEEWLEPFRPTVTSFRILDEDAGIGDTLMYISPSMVEHGQRPSGLSWQEYLIELMRIKAFVFAVATPFLSPLPHNCPHRACRFHRLDMCRGWGHVPAQAGECTFPEWLARTPKRRFDFDAEMLVPIDG